jgi:hypothetical protein
MEAAMVKRLSMLSMVLAIVLVVGLSQALAQDDTLSENNGFIRFANFSPGAVAVDIDLDNGLSSAQGLEFGSFSDWQGVPPGDHTVSVVPAGTVAAAGDGAGPNSFRLSTGQWITVVVVELAADDSTVSTVVVEEYYSRMRPGVTNVTFFNGLSDLRVNFVRNETEFVSELGGPNNAEGLYSSSSFAIDAGTYRFSAHPTGDPETVLGELTDTYVKENDLYFLAVVENVDGGTELVLEPTRWAEVEMALGNLPAPGTLVDVSGSHGLLPLFAQAIDQAGLTETLNGDMMYTIFAPSDDVMDSFMEQFANDSEGLANFLRDHIVEGDLRFNDLMEMKSVTSLNGTTLPLRLQDNTVYVNDAAILTPNVSAMNGTIHIIGLAPGQE